MYTALLRDEQTVVHKPSLELINAIPVPIKYLVKETFASEYHFSSSSTELYAYTAVNNQGELISIEINNFIVVDLGTEYMGKYDRERICSIMEKHSGIIRKFHYVGPINMFLQYKLAPLMRELENAGSWVALDKFKDLEELKKQNDQLRFEISELKSKLKVSYEQ